MLVKILVLVLLVVLVVPCALPLQNSNDIGTAIHHIQIDDNDDNDDATDVTTNKAMLIVMMIEYT